MTEMNTGRPGIKPGQQLMGRVKTIAQIVRAVEAANPWRFTPGSRPKFWKGLHKALKQLETSRPERQKPPRELLELAKKAGYKLVKRRK